MPVVNIRENSKNQEPSHNNQVFLSLENYNTCSLSMNVSSHHLVRNWIAHLACMECRRYLRTAQSRHI